MGILFGECGLYIQGDIRNVQNFLNFLNLLDIQWFCNQFFKPKTSKLEANYWTL